MDYNKCIPQNKWVTVFTTDQEKAKESYHAINN